MSHISYLATKVVWFGFFWLTLSGHHCFGYSSKASRLSLWPIWVSLNPRLLVLYRGYENPGSCVCTIGWSILILLSPFENWWCLFSTFLFGSLRFNNGFNKFLAVQFSTQPGLTQSITLFILVAANEHYIRNRRFDPYNLQFQKSGSVTIRRCRYK